VVCVCGACVCAMCAGAWQSEEDSNVVGCGSMWKAWRWGSGVVCEAGVLCWGVAGACGNGNGGRHGRGGRVVWGRCVLGGAAGAWGGACAVVCGNQSATSNLPPPPTPRER